MNRQNMDNFRFDVTARTPEALREMLGFVMEARTHKVQGYRVETIADVPTIILYQAPSARATPLPAMNAEAASHFVQAWLAAATYPKAPDIDGDAVPGWQLYCGDWGCVGEEWETFAAIRPIWALIGK